MQVKDGASCDGVEYVKWKAEKKMGRLGKASSSLFILLSCIPIGRVTGVEYVLSRLLSYPSTL